MDLIMDGVKILTLVLEICRKMSDIFSQGVS